MCSIRTAAGPGKRVPASRPIERAQNRPVTKVVAEAKQLQAGQPTDKAPRKPREPYTEAVRAVVRLLQQVEAEGQVAWLDAFRTAVEVEQAEQQGRNAAMD